MSMVLFPLIGLFAWLVNLVILVWILQVLKDIRTQLVQREQPGEEGKR